jgi:hypothetical protein
MADIRVLLYPCALGLIDHEEGGILVLQNVPAYQITCCNIPKDEFLSAILSELEISLLKML